MCTNKKYFANVASVGEVAKLLLVVILETRDKNQIKRTNQHGLFLKHASLKCWPVLLFSRTATAKSEKSL